MIVLLAACGGASGISVDATDSAVTTEAAVDTKTSIGVIETTTVPVSAGPETTSSGRPVAPDFTLELNDGGAYTLSDGEKPVYLVFWAEW